MLEHVARKQPTGIINLAHDTGYPRHKVRYSLRVLEEEGAIEPTKQGAVTADSDRGFLERYDERFEAVVARLEELHSRTAAVA
jgi:predicted transcriptional regulator